MQGTELNLENTYIIDAPLSDTLQLASEYFKQIGYIGVDDAHLTYRRGSIFGSLSSFSPRRWKSKVTLELSGIDNDTTKVKLLAQINTIGQKVTSREKHYFSTEFAYLEKLTDDDDVSAIEISNLNTNIHKSGIKGLKVFLVVTVIVYILTTLLSLFVLPSLSGLSTLLSVGSGIFAARKHWGLL